MKFKGRMVKNIKRRMDVMKFKGWEECRGKDVMKFKGRFDPNSIIYHSSDRQLPCYHKIEHFKVKT